MGHVHQHQQPATIAVPLPPADLVGDPTAFGQLRHLTKNVLQRVVMELDRAAGRGGVTGTLMTQLQQRILLSAGISDALFGLTSRPKPLAERLRALGAGVIGMLADVEQQIRLDVVVDGPCPDRQADTIVRVAHEMLGNAVKHGMRRRLAGAIAVLVLVRAGHVRLLVVDDGWGPGDWSPGEGTALMHALAAQAGGGSVRMHRVGDQTMAELLLPRGPIAGDA